ncbi:MAG: DUF3592 domain-containing protein [Bryobacterales bacterium]|nr:DUF3592 domain-containing protein [Bryobacterales bacterium]
MQTKAPAAQAYAAGRASTPGNRKLLIWLGGGALAAAVPLLLFGIWFLYSGMESSRWPTVTGEVVDTRIRVWSSVNARYRRDLRHRRYYPQVEYRYVVDGKEYRSRRYSLGEEHPDFAERAEAVEAGQAFRAGSAVQVSYDPGDPSSAVLAAGTQTGTWVPLLLAIPLGAAGLFLIWLGMRMPPARPRGS